MRLPFLILCLSLIAAIQSQRACAALLVEPDGGTLLFTSSNFDDDATVLFSQNNFGGLFYGQSVADIYVAENGNLNFSNNGDFFPVAGGSQTVARISPLWDDIVFEPSADNAIINHSVPGSYLGVTWQRARLFNELVAGDTLPPTDRSIQALWFETDTTIRGTDFRKDDIVFAYVGATAGTDQFGPIESFVGISNGTQFTPLPGDSDGLITASQSQLLAWEADTYLRFRFNGDSYDALKLSLTAVPEPSWLIIAGALGLARCVRRRSAR